MTASPELTSLRLLLAIDSLGSISEAARQEGMSQPAASKRIAALERALGIALLDRTRAGSRLTSEGFIVADWAGRVLRTVDEMFDAVAAMRSHEVPDLRVASSMTIAEHLVPQWLSALRHTNPTLHVGLRVTNSASVQQMVHSGEVDLGLVETTLLDRRLNRRVVSHDRLAVVVAPGHAWARRRSPLRLRDLAAAQLIVRETGSGTRDTLDRLLAPLAPPEPLLELGSNAAVRGAVRAGAGPAVLSRLAVEDELRAGVLVEVGIAEADLLRPLTAVWRRGETLAAASAALLAVAGTPFGERHV